MKIFRTLVAVAAAGSISLSAADLSKFTADVKRWEIAECTAKTEATALVVNMPVDHKGGQKGYFVGWPRLYMRKFQAQEKDWSKAKAISFDLKLEFTGKTAKYPLTFHVFWKKPQDKKATSITIPVPALKNNSVNKVVLPLNKVADLANVSGIGFNISEAHYKHGENFKFTVSNFKLINK
ncbi:MAG: hypothetical protein IKB99_02280 [Lentisphaeria bacterium]|nr:hypothetical protein [Lentisphaeria bacterium]